MTTDSQRVREFVRDRRPRTHRGEQSAAVTWLVPGAICCTEGRSVDEALDRAAAGQGVFVVPEEMP